MKTVSYDTKAKASKAHADELLPLKLPAERKLQKDECVVFKLVRTTPTDPASPTYEIPSLTSVVMKAAVVRCAS